LTTELLRIAREPVLLDHVGLHEYGDCLRIRFHAKEKKRKKPKKKTYKNWFEKLTADQLKQLCRAAKLPVSGTKEQIVNRLCEGEFSGKYRPEYRVRMEVLKAECREKGLQVSGKRFDLVLRLLQNETGAGGQPKRFAGEIDEEGKFQPKKRAKSMKLPNVDKLTERAFKKAFPPDEVQWKWSNWTSKQHCSRCVDLAIDIIKKEVFEKELFERGEEELAWKVIHAVTRWIVYGNPREITTPPKGYYIMAPASTQPHGMGYASYDVKDTLYPLLMKAMEATSSKNRLQELGGELLRDLEAEARSHCVESEEFSDTLDEYLPDIPKKRPPMF